MTTQSTNVPRAADEILETEYTSEQVTAMGKAVESCPYTSTALAALAAHVRDEWQDAEGALLILAFATRYAEHEATQI